ncbi:SPOR domain-containing protein [Ningiella sp. W23]|uniref:SPOR domain-containing protein n=1 Tax=Ningiella sp. W23 TaxID=3023715 RepID=UPI0037578B62
MNAALQNRLVGTIIVVALVVIVLPEVLDGEKAQSSAEFVDIPDAPPAMQIEEVEPFPQALLDEKLDRPVELIDEQALDDIAPEDRASEEGSLDAASQAPSNDISEVSEQAQVSLDEPSPEQDATIPSSTPNDAVVQDSGWVIQLGSFRYEKNVKELIATLQGEGYRAFSRPVETSVGVLNKVFVGPELQREPLEQALPRLQELTNLKGKITEFEVSAQ